MAAESPRAAGGAGGAAADAESRRKSSQCLVLDMDGTLIDSIDVDETAEMEGSKRGNPHHIGPMDKIFLRPYCDEFLDWAFEHFTAVGLWTMASKNWADLVLSTALRRHAQRFAFVFTSERCTRAVAAGTQASLPPELGGLPPGIAAQLGAGYSLPIKRLRKVWQASSRRALGFRKFNTMIVEDSPHNCVANYGNAIYIETYSVHAQPRDGPDDDYLLRLVHYLASIAEEPDVRTVEKRGWARRIDLSPGAPLPLPGVPVAAERVEAK